MLTEKKKFLILKAVRKDGIKFREGLKAYKSKSSLSKALSTLEENQFLESKRIQNNTNLKIWKPTELSIFYIRYTGLTEDELVLENIPRNIV